SRDSGAGGDRAIRQHDPHPSRPAGGDRRPRLRADPVLRRQDGAIGRGPWHDSPRGGHMNQRDDNNYVELEGGYDEVGAGEVTIDQGGARSVQAHEVQIRQGGAMRVTADDLEVTQGGIAFATTGSAAVTGGGVGVLTASGPVELKAAAAQVVLANGEATVEQS